MNRESQMIYPDIIIPTCKTEAEVSQLIGLLSATSRPCEIIPICRAVSAAINRNAGLNAVRSEIVIMCDDDTSGFYPGWWQGMVLPFLEDPTVAYVSARLWTRDNKPAVMMHNNACLEFNYVEVPYAPTACVAFRNDGLRFNEEFLGSGYEDTWFCDCLKVKYPGCRFVINNRVKIIHDNEMKNQGGKYYEHNKALYEKLTGGSNG